MTEQAKHEPTPWQPIETAPRDGSFVLLWAPDYADRPGLGQWCEVVAAWSSDIGTMDDGPGILTDECDGPTHWAPIPEPPHAR